MVSFNDKYAGVPLWGWSIGGAGVAGLGYYFWRKHQESKAGSTSSGTSNTGTTTSQLNGLEGQISDLYGYSSYPGNGTSNAVNTTVSVPDVTGLSQVDAEQLLTDAGLKPIGSPVVKGSTIIIKSTTPPAGTVVAVGSGVVLIGSVSPGSGSTTPPGTSAGNVTVPDIKGKNIEDAASAVQAVGLKLSPHPSGVKGSSHIVLTQTPQAGSKVKKGSTVTDTYKTVKS